MFGRHPWLSIYIQGLLRNEKELLIPHDCHCGETNRTGTVQIYWFGPKKNMVMMPINGQFALNGC